MLFDSGPRWGWRLYGGVEGRQGRGDVGIVQFVGGHRRRAPDRRKQPPYLVGIRPLRRVDRQQPVEHGSQRPAAGPVGQPPLDRDVQRHTERPEIRRRARPALRRPEPGRLGAVHPSRSESHHGDLTVRAEQHVVRSQVPVRHAGCLQRAHHLQSDQRRHVHRQRPAGPHDLTEASPGWTHADHPWRAVLDHRVDHRRDPGVVHPRHRRRVLQRPLPGQVPVRGRHRRRKHDHPRDQLPPVDLVARVPAATGTRQRLDEPVTPPEQRSGRQPLRRGHVVLLLPCAGAFSTRSRAMPRLARWLSNSRTSTPAAPPAWSTSRRRA